MATLDEATIVAAPETDVAQGVVADDPIDDVTASASVDDWDPEDDDMDEAIGLMWETTKLLKAVLARVKMSAMSRHLIEKHREELLEFIAYFPGDRSV